MLDADASSQGTAAPEEAAGVQAALAAHDAASPPPQQRLCGSNAWMRHAEDEMARGSRASEIAPAAEAEESSAARCAAAPARAAPPPPPLAPPRGASHARACARAAPLRCGMLAAVTALLLGALAAGRTAPSSLASSLCRVSGFCAPLAAARAPPAPPAPLAGLVTPPAAPPARAEAPADDADVDGVCTIPNVSIELWAAVRPLTDALTAAARLTEAALRVLAPACAPPGAPGAPGCGTAAASLGDAATRAQAGAALAALAAARALWCRTRERTAASVARPRAATPDIHTPTHSASSGSTSSAGTRANAAADTPAYATPGSGGTPLRSSPQRLFESPAAAALRLTPAQQAATPVPTPNSSTQVPPPTPQPASSWGRSLGVGAALIAKAMTVSQRRGVSTQVPAGQLRRSARLARQQAR